MRVGFDFDNTLISYDKLFRLLALEGRLIPDDTKPEKNAVRDYLRLQGKEVVWTHLQGEVYGGRIQEAEPYPQMLATLSELAQKGIPMCIVSHKTRTPYLGEPWDLHAAAKSWLSKHGFFRGDFLDWKENQVFFELTKEEKVARIVSIGCTHFVDDLPEILEMLPDNIQKILFSPNLKVPINPTWQLMTAWQNLPNILEL